MKQLMQKEWTLVVTPVPIAFLALSGLLLIPSYPYFVTFFYSSLGIFLMMQSARENNDLAFGMLLPVPKQAMVTARLSTVVALQLLQLIACVPFALVRASYGHIANPVGFEANVSFFGVGLMLLALFNLTFFPMHYKNGYDLGKPFVLSAIWQFLFIAVAETLSHIVPYLNTVCQSYAAADQIKQLPLLAAGIVVYAAGTYLAWLVSVRRFTRVDL